MKAIILVGGQGTRLRPLTLDHPKPLLPILNRPFISYPLRLLRKAGVTDVALAIGKSAKPWAKKLNSFAPKGLKVHFSNESRPMGTGGAIRLAFETTLAKKVRPNEPIIVMNGDVFVNLNLSKILSAHRKNRAEGTLVLTRVKDISRYGHITFTPSGRITQFREKTGKRKPGYINAGAYVLNAGFIKRIPKHPNSIERDIYPSALKRGERLFASPLKGYWNDIGTPATYLQAHKDLVKLKSHWTDGFLSRKRKVGPKGLVKGSHTNVGSRVQCKGVVCLGNKVSIASDCVLEDVVILDGTKVEESVTMTHSLVGRNCIIGKNSALSSGVVLGDKTRLRPYSKL